MWPIRTMDYHLVIKSNEVLIHIATRMKPEDILLSERTQSKEVTYCMTLFT